MGNNEINPKDCGVLQFNEDKTELFFRVRDKDGEVVLEKQLELSPCVGKFLRVKIICVLDKNFIRSLMKKARLYRNEGLEAYLYVAKKEKGSPALTAFVVLTDDSLALKTKNKDNFSQTYLSLKNGEIHEVTTKDSEDYQYLLYIDSKSIKNAMA